MSKVLLHAKTFVDDVNLPFRKILFGWNGVHKISRKGSNCAVNSPPPVIVAANPFSSPKPQRAWKAKQHGVHVSKNSEQKKNGDDESVCMERDVTTYLFSFWASLLASRMFVTSSSQKDTMSGELFVLKFWFGICHINIRFNLRIQISFRFRCLYGRFTTKYRKWTTAPFRQITWCSETGKQLVQGKKIDVIQCTNINIYVLFTEESRLNMGIVQPFRATIIALTSLVQRMDRTIQWRIAQKALFVLVQV